MKKVVFVLSCAALLVAVGASADNVEEYTPGAAIVTTTPGSAQTTWEWPRAVLYDNGPLINCAGCGSGGADESQLQTALGMNILGFGHQFLSGNRIADDFVVPAAGWQIDTITVFAYQTGGGIPSTLTGVYMQIWDGAPDDPASTVVWGDEVTNVMDSTVWSNIYRVTDTSSGDTNRAIMEAVATVGQTFTAGTYWVDWAVDGSAASGPWAPPITIDGQTTTGNGIQYTGTWGPAEDGGTLTQQGFPFIINGTVVPVELQSFSAE